MMNNIVFKNMQEHKPIIINFGKGYLTDKDIKEKAYYDDEIKRYRSETGIWGNKLLREILQGEVENTTIEVGE